MLIDIRNLYKIYNEGKESEVRALDGVTLTIDRGEFVAIIGQSGSGKSTLMNILGCLDIPTYGDYWLDGTDITERTDRELAHIRNKEIGFIFQGYNLIPALSAYENVELPLIYQGVPLGKREDMVMEALEKVSMEDRWQHKPAEMSGGQQQRVAIARAIATHPPIIMADEPTGALRTAPPSSSSPTTTASPPPPSGSSGSLTVASWATAHERRWACEPDPSHQDGGQIHIVQQRSFRPDHAGNHHRPGRRYHPGLLRAGAEYGHEGLL